MKMKYYKGKRKSDLCAVQLQKQLCYNHSMISKKDIENLANLARIRLSEEEKESLAKDVDSILVYVDQIKSSPIGDFKPSAGVVKNVMREDVVMNTSAEDRERLLDEAPKREGDFVAVKKILA
jgi:aspartyl-tRNA(Asn)/glutamyl-tRNA(Gln) amidotransferase subunit C